MLRLFALVSIILLFVLNGARADNTLVFKAMLIVASSGNAEAQYHVGMMYNNGIGTEKNPSRAFEWFQKSAAAKDPLGAYKLGCYYAGQFGGVVPKDPSKALTYKRISADAGYALAQHDVGVHYARSGNVEESLRWFKLAADQGFDESHITLSKFYFSGNGVPQSYPLAFIHYNEALISSHTKVNARDKHCLMK